MKKPPSSKSSSPSARKSKRRTSGSKSEYQETVKGGEKKVAELNERFGDWYYVISDDVYKQIHLGREQIIRKKDKPAEAGKEGVEAQERPTPSSGLPNLPAAPVAEPPADAQPAEPPAEQPAAESEARPLALTTPRRQEVPSSAESVVPLASALRRRSDRPRLPRPILAATPG